MQAIGGYIRGFRLERGMTTAELAGAMAERLGRSVGKSTVTKIEGGEYNPGMDLLVALVAALGASAERVHELALRDDLDVAEGERLGRLAARGEGGDLTPEERRMLDGLPPEKRRQAIQLIQSLLAE